MVLLDGGFVLAAYLLAYLLRFEGAIPDDQWGAFKLSLPYILPFKLLTFWFFGLYQGMWR